MKVEFKESFLKDIKSIRDKSVLAKVKSAIESVELANTFDEITHLKKCADRESIIESVSATFVSA